MRWLLRKIEAWREMRRMKRQREAAATQRRLLRDTMDAARMGGNDYPSAYRKGWSR
jgi:hypothetical protein